ncbi:hypothetical protein [Pseudomonas sp. Marseille-QA0892]
MIVKEPFVLPHWHYFLCLEDDVVRLSRWVEFSEKNLECYSIEIARLLMSVSAEADVVAKLLCKSLNPESTADSIGKYQQEISAVFPTIPRALASIPRHGIELYPWSDWATPKTPPKWWSATNKVKHHRSSQFHQATLENLLDAMGGLLVLLTLYYRKEVNRLMPLSQLFIPKAFLLNMGDNHVRFIDRA